MATLEPFIRERAGPDIDEDAREQALRPIRESNFDTLIEWILGLVDAKRKTVQSMQLLDVGCAHGWFLEKAGLTFQVQGIEPDEEVASRTSIRGVPVRPGYFPDVLADGEKFDVIVFNDVLEHIPRADTVLQHCAERLNPGGLVVVNAPDRRGALYRMSIALARLGVFGPFERLWQKGLPSPHLYYFDTVSVSKLAQSAGLEIVASRGLPSLKARGLYGRIRCAGDVSKLKAAVLTAALLPMVPLLRLLPSDISVWALRAR